MKKLKVNILYPTSAPGGHGVETAFREMVNGLGARNDVEVMINSWAPADIIHAHDPDPISIIKLLRHKGKRVISGHLTRGSMVGSVVDWVIPAEFWWYKRFYKMAEAMVAVSATTKQNLIKEFEISAPIAVIENSIDSAKLATTADQKAAFRKSLGFMPDDFIVVSNGQIQPRKKFDEFIDVARQLPKFRFVWVGGIIFKGAIKGLAADQARLMKMVDEAPENVLVTGVIPLDEARKYLRVSDVYFHPAVQETFGTAIVEGAAAGLPIVLRKIPDYDHTFKNNALLVEPEKFSETLQELKKNRELYKKYRAESAKIAKRYDNSAAAEKLVKFYRQILA
ncbi:MAG: glycosyltransferase family 4 protein [Candidatus Nomurabacteria bacterium]|jgi:glycosyltransferase involved in cell wall biosynthesis|nr:glycosyltransferase family 4 protein [Candidatus Nomurabacteria bacterium]